MSALDAGPMDVGPMEAGRSQGRRVAAGFLALVIVAGSGTLWIGVPLAGFWATGHVTSDPVEFLLIVLLAIPLAMIAGGFALYRVAALYERLHGGEPLPRHRAGWTESLSEERPSLRRRRGRRPLIDVAMASSAVAALVVIAVWFFFFAEMRLAPMQ